jgi:hypothetical protein
VPARVRKLTASSESRRGRRAPWPGHVQVQVGARVAGAADGDVERVRTPGTTTVAVCTDVAIAACRSSAEPRGRPAVAVTARSRS